MGPESADMIQSIMLLITILKPILWPMAFIPVNGMRAAGDVKYALFISAFSMWVFRVMLSYFLCHFTPLGLLSVWIGMMVDWAFRTVCYTWRFFRGRWMQKKVLKEASI